MISASAIAMIFMLVALTFGSTRNLVVRLVVKVAVAVPLMFMVAGVCHLFGDGVIVTIVALVLAIIAYTKLTDLILNNL